MHGQRNVKCTYMSLSLSCCPSGLSFVILQAWQLYGEESLYVLRHLETAAVLRDMIKAILF